MTPFELPGFWIGLVFGAGLAGLGIALWANWRIEHLIADESRADTYQPEVR